MKKINFSQIKIIPADESYRDFSYRVKKSAMGVYITQIWGWDEEEQNELFTKDWNENKPSIILYDDKPIGTILLKSKNNAIDIQRFNILPEYQKKGIGSFILERVLSDAATKKQTVTLAVLKINPAKALYQRYGFNVVNEEELMFFMERRPNRKYKAMIFDLGGTLSCSADQEEYRKTARKIAEICSAPVDKFIELWFSRSADLGVGKYETWPDYIKYICSLLNLDIAENRLTAVAEIPLATTRNQISRPHEGAVELLAYLKSHGYKLGLVSDCFYDVPKVWPETPFAPYFDVTVFSCEVGMNKANPDIFKIALKKMNVEPEDCIYIADGMRNELANAARLGMKAVQLFIPEELYDSPIREDWQGLKISSLKEVLNLL